MLLCGDVGTEDELIFLDPHTLQPVADVTASSEESDETYHYRGRANRIRFQGLDPSIAVVRFCCIHSCVLLANILHFIIDILIACRVFIFTLSKTFTTSADR
jgi:hypothetical protein